MHLRHSKFYPLTLALSRRERELFARHKRQHIPGPHKLAAGFTLIEMVVFIVVLAVGLSGVVLVINRTLLSAPEALVNTRAMEIAQLYLDEILAKKYDENTPQGGTPPCNTGGNSCTPDDTCDHDNPNTFGPDNESRGQFNDVDDYCTTDFQSVTDANGDALLNYDGYDVKIDVVYAGNEIGLNLYQAKRVTVTVRTPRNQQIPVTMYRTNF